MVQASKKAQSGPPQQKAAYPYPSRFGSHISMIQSQGAAGGVTEEQCVCIDEHGSYVTELSRIDDGLADPNRYSDVKRLAKLFANEAKK